MRTRGQRQGPLVRGGYTRARGRRHRPRLRCERGRELCTSVGDEEDRERRKIKKKITNGPSCQWLIPLLMSLDQIENRLVSCFVNQIKDGPVSSLKLEIGPSQPTLSPD